MPKGSLTVVGTGIKAVGQVTLEARASIVQADKVLHHIADPITEKWLTSLNPNEESLRQFYKEHRPRILTYNKMVDCILKHVRSGLNVCAAFYGHPGVFVHPSHESVMGARREGYYARMLPGVSSMDCLFADLGIDPSRTGCQLLEATDFLVYDRFLDVTSTVILWQVGAVGELSYKPSGVNVNKLRILAEALQRYYGLDYEVILYEAAQYSACQPRIERTPLSKLAEIEVTSISTIYIPPMEPKRMNYKMVRRLGIKAHQ
jgi:uncharacterized protein YabN with tetrapyrrole methylase and pyrophosphatase domain